MFWNAMTRKGWNWREEKEEVTPESVTEIIKIHNFNNEKAWHEVDKFGSEFVPNFGQFCHFSPTPAVCKLILL